MQSRFLMAIQIGDKQEIDQLKQEYIENYPSQLEGVEVLFGIGDFLKKQEEFDNKKTG